ncbi:MAG TPA: 4-hydroxy-tetrahydrodipicolinate reductase [Planctomycetaceae bacterium]|nr:4-hydroxy-tetrahydrodipicolinate reductase [Planctomycetaceae bacterium]
MADKIRWGMHGATGRMGLRVIALAADDPSLHLSAAYESAASAKLGQDAGELAGVGKLGIPVTAGVDQHVDVIIDFSVPEACMELVAVCESRAIPLVISTTGFTAKQRETIAAAAQATPILMAPSMSFAVNLAMKLVSDAARVLRSHTSGVDVEIIERHHRFKADAPSGTALKFGEIVAREMGQDQHIHGRHGQIGQRPRNEIGYHALRTGDNVGEHTIVFGMIGETLEVTVRGQSRDSYALGAIAAAKFLVGQRAGLYSMTDVLGL